MTISTIPYEPGNTVLSCLFLQPHMYLYYSPVLTNSSTDWSEIHSIPDIEMTGYSKFLIRFYMKSSTAGAGYSYGAVKINGEFVSMFPSISAYAEHEYPQPTAVFGTKYGMSAFSDESYYCRISSESVRCVFVCVLDTTNITGINDISIVTKKEGGGNAEVHNIKLYKPAV